MMIPFIKFIKSKTIIDIVYLVLMILIVTLIKDMISSMVRSRTNNKRLDNSLKRNNNVVEGFTSRLNCSDSIPANNSLVCDKLTYLLCDENFEKLSWLIQNITLAKNSSGDITQSTLSVDLIKLKYIRSIDPNNQVVIYNGLFFSDCDLKLRGDITLERGNLTLTDGDIELSNTSKSVSSYKIKTRDIFAYPVGGYSDAIYFYKSNNIQFNDSTII